jgi:S1-C subfamily serine protease
MPAADERPLRRVTLYSSSARRPGPRVAASRPSTPVAPPSPAPGGSPAGPSAARRERRWHAAAWRPPAWLRAVLLAAGGAGVALLVVALHGAPAPPRITQRDIDAAVLHTLATKPLPSRAARAAEIVRRAVVRVRGWGEDAAPEGEKDAGASDVGTGVVIVDKGLILTNVHVVAGARRVDVVFWDGTESEATVVAVQPEDDLAVLQARTLPDDLAPATLRSTGDLRPGDEVVAVGFPFGIGPSVSAGVISGLRREFRSPRGQRVLTNLIQFDAAVNPGNSGGPLVTMDGEVVGIVTGILNPTEQRVFVGIGFAVPIENAAAAVGVSPF